MKIPDNLKLLEISLDKPKIIRFIGVKKDKKVKEWLLRITRKGKVQLE